MSRLFYGVGFSLTMLAGAIERYDVSMSLIAVALLSFTICLVIQNGGR